MELKTAASATTNNHRRIEIRQGDEHRPLPTNEIKTQEPEESTIPPPQATTAGPFVRKVFRFLFYLHLILITVFIICLTIYGLIFTSDNNRHFKPLNFYSPLLTSIACSATVAFTWQWVTRSSPSRAIKAAFILSPLLTCAVGVLLVVIGSPGGLAVGAVAVICALIQSLYACWATPRFEYAGRILLVSTAFPPAKTPVLVCKSIATSILYLCLLVSGIERATSVGSSFDGLFISVILLSMAWTMQVFKNMLLVTVARIKYMHLAFGADIGTDEAFRDTFKHLMGSICIASILVPVIGVIRGFARAIKVIAGDTDEFLFSCASCFSGMSSALVMYANRWGLVHVGAYKKGIVQASSDTWEAFDREGLKELIDIDLTGTFCFLSGVSAGAMCSLASGTWTLVIQKSYAVQVSVYAFFIGYFMSRIAMAWPQACVSSYYVAYAEDPQSVRFDSTIPVRLEELRRFHA